MSEERLVRLEKKVDVLTETVSSYKHEMAMMAKTLDKLADVGLNQVRLEGLVMENRKDIDVAFREISAVRSKGTALCGAHLERLKAVEDAIRSMQNRAWQIWLLFLGQFLTLLLVYMRGK